MKNLILPRMIAISIATFLITAIYSVAYTAPVPARRSNNNSTGSIEIELSASADNTSVRAETDYDPNSDKSIAYINVVAKKNGVADKKIRDDVTLVILGFLYPDESYVPIGRGYLHPLQNWPTDNRWVYRAFKEPKSEKHPEYRTVLLGAKYKGRILDKIRINVNTVYRWYASPHQHGPGYSFHSPTTDDYNTAWQYVRWKYGISTTNLNSISYDPNLTGALADTSILSNTRLSLALFSKSENKCASTLGHENVHGGQNRLVPLCLREAEAYGWSIDHSELTGLTREEISFIVQCRSYLLSLSAVQCWYTGDCGTE